MSLHVLYGNNTQVLPHAKENERALQVVRKGIPVVCAHVVELVNFTANTRCRQLHPAACHFFELSHSKTETSW